MSKYQKGELVKFVRYQNATKWEKWHGVEVGKTYEVVQDNGEHGIGIKGSFATVYTSYDQLESIGECNLEELVRKANEGYRAVHQIFKRYPDEVDFSSYNYPQDKWDTTVNWDSSRLKPSEFRVKPKPIFEPFTVGQNWKVELDGQNVKVGCKNYNAKKLKEGLVDLNNGHSRSHNSLDLFATKKGVREGEYLISWEDADKLLEALKKAGF